MEKEQEKIQYISLKDAAQFCNYSQEYLSLRARQGKLKATKIGRNWLTTHTWILEYAEQAKQLQKRLEENGAENNFLFSAGDLVPSPRGTHEITQGKFVDPPENIPTEDSVVEEYDPYIKQISASPFSAFKFGAALALLFAFVGSGFVFGKEGWYKIADDVADYVEMVGKGFDVG